MPGALYKLRQGPDGAAAAVLSPGPGRWMVRARFEGGAEMGVDALKKVARWTIKVKGIKNGDAPLCSG